MVETKRDKSEREVDSSVPASSHTIEAATAQRIPSRNEVAELIARSRNAIAAGKTDVAYEESDKAIKIAPRSSRAWNTKGRAELSRSNYAEAIAAFSTAVAFNPDNAWAWNNLGYAELMLGRYHAAATHLDKATQHPAATGYMFNNLGLALEKLHRFDDARSAFGKAVKLGSEKAVVSARRVERASAIAPPAQQTSGESSAGPLTPSARAYEAHLARVHRPKSVLELAQEEQANWLKETQNSSNIVSIMVRGLRHALGIADAEAPDNAPMHDHSGHSHGPDDHGHSHEPDEHTRGPDDHNHTDGNTGHRHDREPGR